MKETRLQQNRLRWHGHKLRKEDNDWVKKCKKYDVECSRPRGRQNLKIGYAICRLNREDAMDCGRRRKMVKDV